MTSSSMGAGGGFRVVGDSVAVYFESGRIISRIPDIRLHMQNMHADTDDSKPLRIVTACHAGDLI
uniref:hypothetical protein n=1 Tax=Burkholderia sp. AU33423 TaxID=2015355 RepID=UPI0015C6156C|nr:hypothetical protein [Burkholderia sp. AU33423]